MNQTTQALKIIVLFICAPLGVANGAGEDPLEPLNREFFTFNQALDRALIRPAAQGYRAVVPDIVEDGIANFFGNVEDLLVIFNEVLQFKFDKATSDLLRVTINSTFGFAGIIDVAGSIGLPKHDEDFGQTLAVWGVPPGPYLVLPLVGPSTLRDLVSSLAGQATVRDLRTASGVHPLAPLRDIHDGDARNAVRGIHGVSQRASLLQGGQEQAVENAALDQYAFFRSAYLQRRHNQVWDGEPPLAEPPLE